MKRTIYLLLVVFLFSHIDKITAQQNIHIKASNKDFTPVIREYLENAKGKSLTLSFEKGVYNFSSALAANRYYSITNHDNGYKQVIFQAENFESIEIEGNGSTFIFNGRVAPFIFENCKQVSMSNVTIDWKVPFIFQAELVDYNPTEGWRDVKPASWVSWKVTKDKLTFPNVNEFAFVDPGQSFSVDPVTKDIVYGSKGMHSHPSKVEKRPNGLLRIYEKLSYWPPIGSIQGSVGDGEKRYAPGIYVKASSNIHLDGVIVNHALGMGFLFERADNIKLLNSGVYPPEGSDRVVSTIADATHFCNCKGDIVVDNCRFTNMMDDGANVHGTYVIVDELINDYTVRVALKHRQQKGFVFAEKDDEVWFIQQPSCDRNTTNKVKSIKALNETYTELTFKNKLPAQLKKGDVLENKTWNPTFTMRNCSIGNHRARNIVLKTPLKTVIENNRFFSSDLASILFRGEMHHWFESGAVDDVLIQNNYFSYSIHGAPDQALLYISPKALPVFNQHSSYDRNIRFINNTIETFDNRIVWADRVENLEISGNRITQTKDHIPLQPDAAMIELTNCSQVIIKDNSYNGSNKNSIVVDEKTKGSINIKENKGFTKKK